MRKKSYGEAFSLPYNPLSLQNRSIWKLSKEINFGRQKMTGIFLNPNDIEGFQVPNICLSSLLSSLIYFHFCPIKYTRWIFGNIHVNVVLMNQKDTCRTTYIYLGFFVPLENFSLIMPVKGCKFWPMLDTHGHWAVRVL